MMRKRAGTRKDKRKGVKRKYNNIPDQLDIDLHEIEFLRLSKSLDKNGKNKPLTDNQLKELIRSAVRQKWMHSFQKLSFLHSKMVPDTDPNTRRRYKGQCQICKEWFTKTDLDVDHIKGNHEFVELHQAKKWASSILDVGFDDLQLLCNGEQSCHGIKTHSEKKGITFEEASYDKQAIAWEKHIKKVPLQKSWLMERGFSEQEVSNGTKRRECYIKHIKSQEV